MNTFPYLILLNISIFDSMVGKVVSFQELVTSFVTDLHLRNVGPEKD